MMEQQQVVIIGAGVAGLTCAQYLQRFQIPFTILEASDEVGGRVRTDKVEGFQLDRGFQIFLTAYEEARRVLNYEELELKPFRKGAVVRLDDRFTRVVNPLQEPLAAPQTLVSPVGTLTDKLKVLQLVRELNSQDDQEIFQEPAVSTIAYLSGFGWSEKMIKNFFQPFLGGVFLEKELITSSNFFRFVFQKFYEGDATLPARGIGSIPKQLAARLPAGSIQTGVQVQAINGNTLLLSNGESLTAAHIVVATDAQSASRLLGEPSQPVFNQTTCVYFAAETSPLDSPLLVINADSQGLINNLSVPSDIAPDYAPEGKSLISVSVVGGVEVSEAHLVTGIRAELAGWFGEQVQSWRHLKTYYIPEALPRFTARKPAAQTLKLTEGLYRCGDYTAYPSLNAAMLTGRQVAEMIAGK